MAPTLYQIPFPPDLPPASFYHQVLPLLNQLMEVTHFHLFYRTHFLHVTLEISLRTGEAISAQPHPLSQALQVPKTTNQQTDI